MIIKGSTRGGSPADAIRLADHLMAAENERADMIELRGVVAQDLASAIEEMRVVSLATRSRRPLYHCSINVDPTESRQMSVRRWIEAADELEHGLGLDGHQRALVQHTKHGRIHLHIVWSRVNPATLKVAHDGQSYRIHEQTARTLEQRWRLRPTIGVHTRAPGTTRPVARLTHCDHQAQTRTGVPIAAVSAALQACWQQTTDAGGFAEAVSRTGLTLARGHRGIIAIDTAGTPHSLPRRLKVSAAEVRRRLAELDDANLPTVDDVKDSHHQPTSKRRTTMVTKHTRYEARRGRRRGQPPEVPQPLNPAYWRDRGHEVIQQGPMLLVTLSGGTIIEDHGDRLTLLKSGEPTDDEIRLLVETARARGWQGIRFFGGSAAFQQRARLEALRQGYPMSAISLECEDHRPPPTMGAMPDHIRRRLIPDPTTPPEAPPPTPDTPAAPRYRP